MNNSTHKDKAYQSEKFYKYRLGDNTFRTNANKEQFGACVNFVKTLPLPENGKVQKLMALLDEAGFHVSCVETVDETFSW